MFFVRVLSTALLLGVVALPLTAAKVTALFGDVKVRPAGGAAKPLKPNDRLGDGDLVLTGNGASVTIEFRDGGAVSVKGSSKYLIGADPDTKDRAGSKSMLIGGKASLDLSKIKKLYADKDDDFKVYTPTAVCGVRGTRFDVTSDHNGRMNLGVNEGAVAVAGDPIRDGGKLQGPVAKAGQGFSADKGGALTAGKNQVPNDGDVRKEAEKGKVDPAYEEYYLGLAQDLAAIAAKLYEESMAKKAESEKLANDGKVEEARKIGIEKFLKGKEALHRIRQFRGYLVLLEPSGVRIPQAADLARMENELIQQR